MKLGSFWHSEELSDIHGIVLHGVSEWSCWSGEELNVWNLTLFLPQPPGRFSSFLSRYLPLFAPLFVTVLDTQLEMLKSAGGRVPQSWNYKVHLWASWRRKYFQGGLWVPAGFWTLIITVLYVQLTFVNWFRFWFLASDFEVGRSWICDEVRSQWVACGRFDSRQSHEVCSFCRAELPSSADCLP